MHYVGLDVHWKQSSYCVLDQNGKRLEQKNVTGTWDKVLVLLGSIPRPFSICFEASTGYGYLYEKLKHIAHRVVVAHPGQLRLIFRSKRKNDRVDAEKLAKLLFLDEVPSVYVPTVHVRSWRAIIEHRSRLVGERTRAKNQMRSLLRTNGVAAPKSLWSRAGHQWLRSLGLPTEMDALQRDILLERLESLAEMIKRVEKILDQYGNRHPGVVLLETIPGVGIRTAEAVVAYIDKPDRFSRSKEVGSYFGLVPCQDASAQQNRLGHITREGPSTVRKFLVEATWQGIRRSPTIRAFFLRIMQGNSERKKIALVATAHYLVRVMFAMLRTGAGWREAAA